MNYYDRVQGTYYAEMLRTFMEVLKPQNYIEIGSRTGDSIATANCATIAIDPVFSISNNVIGKKPSCHFYQMSSDKFFENHNPKKIFNAPIDFAFLDGMHLAEFLIRDIRNVEQYARRNTLIAIHDCLPGEYGITLRQEGSESQRAAQHPEWWTGDVWKIIPILKKYRPDLKLMLVDAAPTGLVLITNLDPSSKILFEKYNEINSEINDLSKEECFEKMWNEAQISMTSNLVRSDEIWQHFWL